MVIWKARSVIRLAPVSAISGFHPVSCVILQEETFEHLRKETQCLQMNTANVWAQPPSGWFLHVPQGYSSITRQKQQGSRDLVFAISTCKIAVLKGVKKKLARFCFQWLGLALDLIWSKMLLLKKKKHNGCNTVACHIRSVFSSGPPGG